MYVRLFKINCEKCCVFRLYIENTVGLLDDLFFMFSNDLRLFDSNVLYAEKVSFT